MVQPSFSREVANLPVFAQTLDERPLTEIMEWFQAFAKNRVTDAAMAAMVASMKADMRAEVRLAHPWLHLEE